MMTEEETFSFLSQPVIWFLYFLLVVVDIVAITAMIAGAIAILFAFGIGLRQFCESYVWSASKVAEEIEIAEKVDDTVKLV